MSKERSRHGPGHPGWDLQWGLCLCPEWAHHGKEEQYTGMSILHVVGSPGWLRQSCRGLAQPGQGLRPLASPSPNHSLPCCPSGPSVHQVPPSTGLVHCEPLFCQQPVLAVCPLCVPVLHQAGLK